MFLGYIHYFRAVAIIFIITGHSIDAFVWSEHQVIEKILRVFIENGTVLFVFISGYLFQHLSASFDIRKYYKSKFKNVITPYFIISIPAILIFITILERDAMWSDFYSNPVWAQIGLFYLTGKHLAPFWFIPVIAIFYIIAPLMIKADENKSIYYLLPVFILISCLVDRGLPFQSFLHYFSAYLLGMWCSKFKNPINAIISQNFFIISSLTLILMLAVFELIFMHNPMSYVNYLQKVMLAFFFLGLLIKYNAKLTSKWVGIIADTSFGIFFIHSYFLTSGKLLYRKMNGQLPDGNIFLCLLLAISTLIICSFMIVQVQKTLGKKSRYFVGS